MPAPIPHQRIRHFSPFAAAACIPLNLALYVHCPNRLRPYSAGAHLPAATMAPTRPTTPKALLYRCHIRYPSQLRRAPSSFFLREASLALVTAGAHLRPQTRALSFPSVKYSFSCFHGMRYHSQLCNKYETIFSRARRKSDERCT